MLFESILKEGERVPLASTIGFPFRNMSVLLRVRLSLVEDACREDFRRMLAAYVLWSSPDVIYIDVLARARDKLAVSGASVFRKPKCASLTEVTGSLKD